MNLSKTDFGKASDFIQRNARKIDVRLYEYYFEGGSAESVLAALAEYQNQDGGFGHGLEPDFRLWASSPMATSVAFQYCVAVNARADHPLVAPAIRYLTSTYDLDEGYWLATFPDVNDEPHAPWWHVKEVRPPDESDWPNPSAELTGYLFCYAQFVAAEFLRYAGERARRNLNHSATIEGWYRYNILCWQRAAPYLPTAFKNKVEDKIRATFTAYPLTEENYGEVRIAQLAPSPDSILAQMMPNEVDEFLNQEIAWQTHDGGWWPTWQWGQYEDVWQIAKREWAGKITVEMLHILRNYGKIEGM